MIIINDNDYSNPCDESNDNKTKIKEWITKIIKLLLARVAIKTLIIEIIELVLNNSNNSNNNNNNNNNNSNL